MPQAQDKHDLVRWLDEVELLRLLDEMPQRPMLAGEEGLRLSLAGAQDKLPVVAEDHRIGLPLFNQGQGPRAKANAELRRAQNEAIATAVELRATARATRQRVLGAYAEAKHLFDVVLPNRGTVLSETLKQYNAMNASTFELLVARTKLVEAGRDYVDALRRFWIASADARALSRGGMPVSEESP